MLTRSLTEPSIDIERSCHVYGCNGRQYHVWDDALTVISIVELFRRDDKAPNEKMEALITSLFVDPLKAVEEAGEELAEVLSGIVWDACGLDIMGKHKDECSGEEVIDWENDASAIRATLLQAYALRWEAVCRTLSYAELCDLIAMAPSETPMGQALYYRTADEPQRTKYNEEQVRRFRKCRDYWALGSKKPAMQAMNDRLGDMFASITRKCENA